MAIRYLPTDNPAFLSELTTNQLGHDRVLMSFRQSPYPPLRGSLTFTVCSAADNVDGSHYVSGGFDTFLYPMPSRFTLELKARANFPKARATDQFCVGWYYTASRYFYIHYDTGTDAVQALYRNGGTERILSLDACVSDADIAGWKLYTFYSGDLETPSDTGAAWEDGDLQGAAWSGSVDDLASVVFPIFSIRSNLSASLSGDWDIAWVRVMPSYNPGAADFTDLHIDNEEEEVFWGLNGEAVGRARCDITRLVAGFVRDSSADDAIGGGGADSLGLMLYSPNGEFADDQYAAFEPSAEIFNGSISQKYMQHRCPVWLQAQWGLFMEPVFFGRVDEELFRRSTTAGDTSMVAVGAEDWVSEIARSYEETGMTFNDQQLSDPAAESVSILHRLVRQATKRPIKNYLPNSSFENATLTWALTGSGATFARSTTAPQVPAGSYVGALTRAAVHATGYLTIAFDGNDDTLNLGDTFTFQLLAYGDAACSVSMSIEERTAALTLLDSTESAFQVAAAAGFSMLHVTHTVTDALSRRLRVKVTLKTATTLRLDCAMLTRLEEPLYWFILNSGASSESDDAASAGFDTLGFDVDEVEITHPFLGLDEGETPWDHIKQIGVATAARICSVSQSGGLRYRSPLKTGYTDPSPITTVQTAIGVESSLTLKQANWIVVHGVEIVKSSAFRWLWSLRDSQFWADEVTAITLTAGETFPDPALFGDFWMQYSEGDVKLDLPNFRPMNWRISFGGMGP